MTEPPMPAEAPPPPAAAPPPAAVAQPASKLRLYLVLGGIVVFLVVVLWLVRDNQAVGDLTVGTCFDVPARASDISTVTRHDCAEAHDAEVFQVADYRDGSSYPISLSLDRFIDATCVPAFETYVGEAFDASEDLTIGYFYPSRDGWNSGDRTFTCYAVRLDEAKLTGSLKGSRDR